MGCNSSAVVPLTESDTADDGAGIKVRVNPSTPEAGNDVKKDLTVRKASRNALESSDPPEELLTKDFNLERRVPPPPPLAFEIPIHENGDSIIRRHPPKRFKRLEESQTESRDLTQEWIDGKQMEAEARRNELLLLRMQSANQGSRRRNRRRLVHSDAFHQESDETDPEKVD